jgi:hypothetical protein
MPKPPQGRVSPDTASQASIRKSVDVGSDIKQVSTVAYWYRSNYFASEDEARGAFLLAYQQGLDGMGRSTSHWMGLTDEEYAGWMKNEELPKKSVLES